MVDPFLDGALRGAGDYHQAKQRARLGATAVGTLVEPLKKAPVRGVVSRTTQTEREETWTRVMRRSGFLGKGKEGGDLFADNPAPATPLRPLKCVCGGRDRWTLSLQRVPWRVRRGGGGFAAWLWVLNPRSIPIRLAVHSPRTHQAGLDSLSIVKVWLLDPHSPLHPKMNRRGETHTNTFPPSFLRVVSGCCTPQGIRSSTKKCRIVKQVGLEFSL